MKIKYLKFQNIDPEICLILIVLEKGLGIVSPSLLCIIFQENCFLYYTLLIDQISLPDCLYFLRYWSICLLQLFVNQVMTS